MEALPAKDCAHWRSAVDPDGARDCSGAIAHLADFPVLDVTVQRVIALCDDEQATTADLVDALEGDPSFSANLLRFANSAAQAHPIRAKSVRQAVMLVGRRALRRLAIEAATFRFLERARGNGGAACGDLHLHAVSVATCAVVAATRVGVRGEAVHLGALLHDVGKLVLPAAFGAADCDAIAADHPGGADRVRAERERFRIDHAQAGALLCLAWNLPDEVAAAVAWHHGGVGGTTVPDRAAACIQLADGVAAMAAGREPDRALLGAALTATALAPPVFDEIAAVAIPDAPPAGALARCFGDQGGSGGEDSLTSLPDRERWLGEVEGLLTKGVTGSVILLDVDGLAAVNAAHGTRVGDFVLTQLARAVSPHGHAGRVGGDEIAVFAELPLADADDLASSIARQVTAGFAQLDGAAVRVSPGVVGAGHDPGVGARLLLDAAARVLAAAKRAAA
jgi:diguanylate cyclase (GGDEF)-like protein/putative nucleotidyltransferase with HDIG domain